MRAVVLTICITLAMTVATFAAEEVTPDLNQGTKELRLNGSLDTDTPLDYEYTIGGAFGIFVIDHLELGVGIGARGNDLQDALELGGFAEYYFDMGGSFVPFLTVGAAYAAIEVDDDLYNKADGADFDTAVVKAGGGIAYFLRDGVAIEVRGMFSKATDDLYVDEDGNREDTNFTTSLGIRFYWD